MGSFFVYQHYSVTTILQVVTPISILKNVILGSSLQYRFSKIIPSFFTIKEGSTSHPCPLSSGAREETALLGARNRYALRLADHQRSSPVFAGWDRRGTA